MVDAPSDDGTPCAIPQLSQIELHGHDVAHGDGNSLESCGFESPLFYGISVSLIVIALEIEGSITISTSPISENVASTFLMSASSRFKLMGSSLSFSINCRGNTR